VPQDLTRVAHTLPRAGPAVRRALAPQLIASDGVDTCAEALRRAVREADDGPDDAAAPETGMDTN